MANKILPESLIALEYERCKVEHTKMPIYVSKWVAKHGVPNSAEIFAKQQKIVPDARKKAAPVNEDELPEVLKNILIAEREYGGVSIECTNAIYNAHESGYSFYEIAKQLHKAPEWIRRRAERRPPIMIEFQNLYHEEANPRSKRMIEFYKKACKQGTSVYTLANWARISRHEMKILVQN